MSVKVTPRSSREKIEVDGPVVKVWVMASPTDGEANRAVLRVLAKALGVAPTTLSIARGESSREKVIDVPMAIETAVAKLGL